MPWPQTTPLTPLYPDLDRFMNDVTNKLKKLNVLDDIHSRLINLESHCVKIDSEVSDIKRQVEEHSANFINIDNGLGEMHGKLKCRGTKSSFVGRKYEIERKDGLTAI